VAYLCEEGYDCDKIVRPKLKYYNPSTPGWKAINDRRFKQLASSISDEDDKYSFYSLLIHSAVTSQNFTEFGWALTKAPQGVVDKLKHRLQEGLKRRAAETGDTNDRASFFIPDEEQNDEIVEELLPLHEAWSGVKLIPYVSYGLRVYRGNISLDMHIDRPDTHVISSILHVDHGEHDEPWPIVIEDFLGNTNEIFLESGDMLFYESSKCMHGRPTKYFGDYYTSLFTHYSPVENWDHVYEASYAHIPEEYGVPQKLDEGDDTVAALFPDGTIVVEPSCDNSYCGLKNSIKWHSPAPGYGKTLSANGKVTELEGIPSETAFSDPSHTYKRREIYIEAFDWDEF